MFFFIILKQEKGIIDYVCVLYIRVGWRKNKVYLVNKKNPSCILLIIYPPWAFLSLFFFNYVPLSGTVEYVNYTSAGK